MTDAIQKAREALRSLATVTRFELGDNVAREPWKRLLTNADAALAALDAETEVNAEEIKGRAASVLCEAGALCGWPAPNCNAREGAEALFKAGLLALVTPESRS